MLKKSRKAQRGRFRRRRGITAAGVLAGVAAETAFMRYRGYRVGLKTIVRCHDGHLFTTIWIPGASLKAVRLGPLRLQYCPVGRHFTSVRPLKEAELTDEIRSSAGLHHDVSIP